jgi:hypothetical protein
LWFWLIVLLIVSIYGFFQTLLKLLPFSTQLFIGHHLRAQSLYDVADGSGVVLHFIEDCPSDVILMLRLYEVELDNTLVGEIIGQLFLMYKEEHVFLSASAPIQLG